MSKIKVACCWDDGVYNDIPLTALLRKYNAKATFNLCPGRMEDNTSFNRWAPKGEDIGHLGFISGRVGINQLREVYGDFQVASHCWFHDNADELDVFMPSAIKTRQFLENVFQRECPGLAYPNGRFTKESADALRAAGFTYARTTRYTEAVSQNEDMLQLHSTCHFMDRCFYARYKQVKEGDGIFYFWGHAYEMLDSAQLWQQFENKLAFIAEDPDAEWIDVCDIPKLVGK